jgi:hypothetical protein
MNKNELIEKAVNIFGGKWPSNSSLCVYMYRFESLHSWECGSSSFDSLFTRKEFNAAAKRLGYINGYKWGVEYPTNGNRPDLPDDVVVRFKESEYGWDLNGAREVWKWNWVGASGFKITDQRYKPADEKTEIEKLGIMPPMNKNERCSIEPEPAKPWFEAGELPRVGECCEYKFQNPDVSWQLVQINYISSKHAIVTVLKDSNECHIDGFKAADFKPIKTDKEKAIEAAIKAMQPNALTGTMALWFGKLYDAGLLRLPDTTTGDK